MRAQVYLAEIAFVSAGLLSLFVACGGSTDDSVDAASDSTVNDGPMGDGKADATTDVVDAKVPCKNDADLGSLNLPDVALNDAGATVQGCANCLSAKCKTDIDSCNAECTCKDAVLEFYTCIGQGKSIQLCGLAVYTKIAGTPAEGIGISLLTCAASSCTVECPAPSDGGSPPTDSGAKDSGGGG